MRKRIVLLLTAVATVLCMCGCSLEDYKAYKEKHNDFTRELSIIAEAFESKDVSQIEELFFTEAMEEIGIFPVNEDEISEFVQDYSKTKKVLVNCGGYLGGSIQVNGKNFKEYSAVNAIIITEDNAYALSLSFCVRNRKGEGGVTKLIIETAKSEAYENLDYSSRNFKGDFESFTYLDDYDEAFDEISEYNGQYKVILGEIVAFKDTANSISLSDAEDFVTDTTTLDDVVNEFGEYAACWNGHCLCYYFKLEGSDEFMRFGAYDDNVVKDTGVSGELYPGWVEL